MARKYDLGSVVGKIHFDYDKNGIMRARDDMGKFIKSTEVADKRSSMAIRRMNANFLSVAKAVAGAALAISSLSALGGGIQALSAVVVALAGVGTLLPGIFAAGAAAAAAFALGMDGIKKAFEGLKPQLDQLKKDVSASFEKALIPAVNNLKGLLPQVTKQFQGLATALGGVATRFTIMLKAPENLKSIQGIITSTTKIVQNLGKALAPIGQAFIDIAAVGAEVMVDLTAGAGSAAEAFAAFIRQARESGAIRSFIEAGIAVFKQLYAIMVQVVGIIDAVVRGFAAAGTTVGGSLVEGLRQINAFLSGIQGQEILKSIATSIQRVGVAVSQILVKALETLGPILPPLLDAFAQLAEQLVPVLTDMLEFLAPVLMNIANFLKDNMDWLGPLIIGFGAFIAVVSALNAILGLGPIGLFIAAIAILVGLVALIITYWEPISNFFENLWNTVWKWTSDRITDIWNFITSIFSNVASFFMGIGTRIGQAIIGILNWFAALPGRIGAFLATLPGILWNAFTSALQFAATAVYEGIQWIIAFFIAMPINILLALRDLGLWVGQKFREMTIWVIQILTEFIANVIRFFLELPGKIVEALVNLREWVGNLISDAWNWAVDITRRTIDNMINFVRTLPQKIMDGIRSLNDSLRTFFHNAWNRAKEAVITAAEAIWNFVRSIPGRIMDALGDLGNLLWNAGKAIVNGLLNGIKSAIGAVWDFVGGIADKIARLKGPLPYDLRLLVPAGLAIAQGLMDGLEQGMTQVFSYMGNVADQIAASIDTETIVTPLGQAAQEIIDAITAGKAVFEDLSFSGNSDLVSQFNDQLLDMWAASGQRGDGTAESAAEWLRSVVGANTSTQQVRAPIAPISAPPIIQNLNLNVAGNLDPTNPTGFRRTMVAIQDGIRTVERQNA
jgi:phage-related protein